MVGYDFDWYLLAGEETALPTISRWLEQLPAGARAIVLVEVADAAEEQPLPSEADVSLRWLHRGGAPPGTTDLLEHAVRGLQLPAGDGYVWVGGEAGCLRPVRRYLIRELGLNPEWVEVDGYWKRGVVNLDHHQRDDDD
jgi:NADPH-dependent ferric siderophore reductase